MDPDSPPPPPPPPYSHLPPATRDDQLMSQTRRLSAANCRRVYAPPALSGPLPKSAPRHDAFATTGTRTPTSLAVHRSTSSDAQPLAAAFGISQESLRTAVNPRAWTYTQVSLSRELSPSLHNPSLQTMPTEILLQILGYLDVCDLLPTSRVSDLPQQPRTTLRECPTVSIRPNAPERYTLLTTVNPPQACHYLRSLCVAPVLHQYRLRRTRLTLPPLLALHNRLSLEDLITRSIFLTHTSVVSRKLARSLVSIRLSRRLAARPSPEALVQRSVLPPECVPGMTTVHVVPGLVAKRKAIEKERVKDGLRRWIAAKWRGEVHERELRARHRDEMRGVGRVWRLTRFWEQLSREDQRLVMR